MSVCHMTGDYIRHVNGEWDGSNHRELLLKCELFEMGTNNERIREESDGGD